MASNAVRSSQAISIMREISASVCRGEGNGRTDSGFVLGDGMVNFGSFAKTPRRGRVLHSEWHDYANGANNQGLLRFSFVRLRVCSTSSCL